MKYLIVYGIATVYRKTIDGKIQMAPISIDNTFHEDEFTDVYVNEELSPEEYNNIQSLIA